ncbi:response regulator [Spirosoma rhododendri]|uniref:Response regulator n=2 Tax=Spirosoma rhododendri TaxID=2728024 RepID=A0A7L5DZP9_9BACT|nr:response regulator [Spirosoma rhododendri]
MRTNVGPQPLTTPIKSANAATKRVLIIDDESDICLLLSGLLRKLGYIPTCAQFIEEGRQCLSTQQYDAIFLDLNLPDGLGFDLLPVIREDQVNARVIMISAFDGQAERRRAEEQGADFFVGKPFTRLSVEKALQSTQV